MREANDHILALESKLKQSLHHEIPALAAKYEHQLQQYGPSHCAWLCVCVCEHVCVTCMRPCVCVCVCVCV